MSTYALNKLLRDVNRDPGTRERFFKDAAAVAAGIHVDSNDTLMFYNAGIDPDARELSPGVILAAKCVQFAVEQHLSRVLAGRYGLNGQIIGLPRHQLMVQNVPLDLFPRHNADARGPVVRFRGAPMHRTPPYRSLRCQCLRRVR